MLFKPGQKLLMIGDSVTDAERARPVGEGLFGAAGKGYVSLVDALLMVHHPELALRVVNMGASGNTVRDLAARWKTDVTDQRPDWVAVCIGINDVWRQFDLPRQPEAAVPLAEYARILDQLVARTRGKVAGMVLMTPYYIEPRKDAPMRRRMDQYGAVVRDIAAKRRCVFVDTQAAFDRLCATHPVESIAWDRVHPNHIGAACIASAFLNAVGFAWATPR
jgi:lysophospholipase L1-like esterase